MSFFKWEKSMENNKNAWWILEEKYPTKKTFQN